MKLDFNVENLSPITKKLLLVVPSLVIVVLTAVMFILPSIEEKNRLSEEIKKQSDDITIAQQKTAKLSTLIAENERLKNKLFELQIQLPEEKEVTGLLKQVSELGVKSGLQIISWKPKNKVVHPSEEVYEIPVDVEMRGAYHRFGQFFSNITKLNRIVNIANINMKTSELKGITGLNVSFTSMTYSLIPEKEKKELQKAKEAAKDKKK
jgi:type IV pilus assembly protein PilO